jgi:pSer/pThr/pTyr-binding forkhead associated (FHA) protein
VEVVVQVVDGPGKGNEATLTIGDVVVVGRAADAGLRVRGDRHISRQHFRVELTDKGCFVVDLGSQNGTLVNSRVVRERQEISNGARLAAGSSKFVVSVSQALAESSGSSRESTVEVTREEVICAVCGKVVEVNRSTVSFSLTMAAFTLGDEYRCRSCRTIEAPAPSGEDFPGYRILEQIGEGSMGTVYLVERATDSTMLALKALRAESAIKETDVKRFLREAALLSELQHPNIIGFVDQGFLDGEFYFVMEYVEGVDLDLYRRQAGGKIRLKRAIQLMCQVLDGLAFAHEKGFVHRDVKPANILVGVVDGQMATKLSDFGLAKQYRALASDTVTRGHISFGTPDYMPPEQITHFKEADPRGDLYSVGASLYHLLAGKTLFAGVGRDDPIRTLLDTTPPSLLERAPEVPEAVAQAVQKAINREPELRWQSAGQFRDALLSAYKKSME